jgi:hypothetical protein
VFGVLTSPRATYAEVATRPRWFGALALVMVVTAVAAGILFFTKVGQEALLDLVIQRAQSSGQPINDAAYQRLQQLAPYAGYVFASVLLVAQPVLALVVAGVLYATFSAGLGGDATFKQVFSIVAHASVVLILSSLFVFPLDYARGTLTSPTSLAVFMPVLDENSFPALALGSIDLFRIWWMFSLAIGMGVLYKRRTTPIAATFLIAYGAIGVTIAAVRSALAGA